MGFIFFFLRHLLGHVFGPISFYALWSMDSYYIIS